VTISNGIRKTALAGRGTPLEAAVSWSAGLDKGFTP